MSSEQGAGDEAPEPLPDDWEYQPEVFSMRGDAQLTMDRRARGEPPPTFLDRLRAWLPWFG